MAQRQGEVKKRAQIAKQRLKRGYWESVRRENAAEDRADETVTVKTYVRSVDHVSAAAPDEKMYKKVCAILDRDEATLNPIGQLIDNDVYTSLDAASKQRYILELSNKFRELKERYYKERIGS